jgi:hypothetical protein
MQEMHAAQIKQVLVIIQYETKNHFYIKKKESVAA